MLSFKNHLAVITCPNQHTTAEVCLSHTCPVNQPFICANNSCKSSFCHLSCKRMRKEAFEGYLVDWKKWVNTSSRQFMERTDKIFANLRDKVARQENRFNEYCKEMFLGKDYNRLIALIERRQFKLITSQLVSSSLRKITEPIEQLAFKPFTLSEMTAIDNNLATLFTHLENTYAHKQTLQSQSSPPKRCNSATLNRNTNSTGTTINRQSNFKQTKNQMFDLLKMKVDLNYPKVINSKLIKDAASLNKLIGFKINKYNLVYRASESSFSIGQFYRKNRVVRHQIEERLVREGKKGDLMNVIVIKSQFGRTIGGVTQIKWEQPVTSPYDEIQEDQVNPELSPRRDKDKQKNSKFKYDLSASTNLFSLDLFEKYQLNQPEEAIYCGKKSIGFGLNDLRIFQKSNQNRRNYCKFPNSYNYTRDPYLKTTKSGMQLSGSKYSPFFKIEEWQCFIIQK